MATDSTRAVSKVPWRALARRPSSRRARARTYGFGCPRLPSAARPAQRSASAPMKTDASRERKHTPPHPLCNGGRQQLGVSKGVADAVRRAGVTEAGCVPDQCPARSVARPQVAEHARDRVNLAHELGARQPGSEFAGGAYDAALQLF